MKIDPMNENLLETQIVLLQKALDYYADENNYKLGNIERDKGHIARHTLDLVKTVNEQIAQTKESYEKSLQKIGENYLQQLDNEILTEDEIKSIQKLDVILNIVNERQQNGIK